MGVSAAGTTRKLLGKALGYGAITLFLYILIFRYEQHVLTWTTKGRFYFLLPVGFAFAFSFLHGLFTSCFWAALGYEAKAAEEK